MKKILLTIALVAAAATSAFAQISVGAGYLANTQKSSYTSGSTTTTTTTPLNGFYVGADYTVDLGQGLGVVAGLKGNFLFNKEEGSITIPLIGTFTGTAKTSEVYLVVPVLANYTYVLGSDLKLFGFAGPSLAYGLSSKVRSTTNTSDDVTITNNYGDNSDYGKMNLFLGAGVGVDVMNTVRIKAGYDIGLLDRDARDDYKVNDAQWYVGVAYLF